MKVNYDKLVRIETCDACPLKESCEERGSFSQNYTLFFVTIEEGKDLLLSFLMRNDWKGFSEWLREKSLQIFVPPIVIREAIKGSLRIRGKIFALRN